VKLLTTELLCPINYFVCSRDLDLGELSPGELEVALDVLADDGLLVVAGNVVPLDTVSVEVVQDCHERLRLASLLVLFPVVWLSARGLVSSGTGPIVESIAVCGRETGLVGGPEPPVDVLGEEVGPVAPVEVTEATGGPEVGHVLVDEPLDPVVLRLGLEGDEVHAPLAAVVTRVEPIPLSVPDTVVIVLPREPVQVPVVPLHSTLAHSIFTEEPIGEAKFAGVLAVVPSAVGGEELVSAGGLRPRGAPVRAQAPVENVVKSAHYGTENVLKWTKEVAEKLCAGRAEANSQKD